MLCTGMWVLTAVYVLWLLLCEQHAGIAVLQMCKKPVNSLNHDMLNELTATLDKLESSSQCSALVITSVCAHVFCFSKIWRFFRQQAVLRVQEILETLCWKLHKVKSNLIYMCYIIWAELWYDADVKLSLNSTDQCALWKIFLMAMRDSTESNVCGPMRWLWCCLRLLCIWHVQAVPKVFCAGLDIQELYQPERRKLMEFWRSLQTFWMKLYVSPLATVAAINVYFSLWTNSNPVCWSCVYVEHICKCDRCWLQCQHDLNQ